MYDVVYSVRWCMTPYATSTQAVDDWSIALSDAAKACRASSGGDQVGGENIDFSC